MSFERQPFFPAEPTTIAATGLSMGFISDLVLKVVYFHGTISARQIAFETCLPLYGVLDQVLQFLKIEEYVDIIGTEGSINERGFQYTLANKGRIKIAEVLDRSHYAGPAPVPLARYINQAESQQIGDLVIDGATVRRAFNHLVISDRMLDRIGPAANSARSLFLYGPPGNGKTTIAEGIAGMLGGHVLIPHAIEVDGQVIKLYDPIVHTALEQPTSSDDAAAVGFDGRPLRDSTQPDRRWMLCERPRITVGGELLIEQLELIFDPITKVYEAPFQLKANGGLLLIDDFGRQKSRPKDLLNRWIVPLEKKEDYLALQTGKKLRVPFDVLIVFSTNLNPQDLVDDAFLRRIRHKLEVGNPTPDEFREITRRVCQNKQIPYSDDGLRHLIQEHYFKANRELRACHPRDLCDQILDEARYRGVAPQLTRELIDRACEAYFVKLG